jgi:stage IV sporulation protein B
MAKKVNFKFLSILLIIIFSISTFAIPVQAKTDKVIIGGESFGLKLYCKGVMVTNLESFEKGNQKVCPAEECGLKQGDIITKINAETVKSNEKVSKIIKQSKGKALKVTIERDEKYLEISATPQKNNKGVYCLGMWIRDSCAGIGTISFYTESDNNYGALGHGICDIDTGGIMESDSGEILKASITSVNKSENSNIGTLNGYFTNEVIGTITNNSEKGIYGKTTEKINKTCKAEVANNSEVKVGEAIMYSTISGTTPKAYKIEITQICNYDKNSNRNFVIKVTDDELLDKTGGIVQGMSGSPIIQNGKFVGALTHVFVESCTQGYGILAENMIDNI